MRRRAHEIVSTLDKELMKMQHDFDILTGTIIYKDIEFTFTFDKHELHLIPPKEKAHETSLWFMEEIEKGVYVNRGSPLYLEVNCLVGQCHETSNKIIFLPYKRGVGCINSILVISINEESLYLCAL